MDTSALAVTKFVFESEIIRYVENDDRMVIHWRKGTHEKETLAAWSKLIEPDFTAVDVGAYTGLFSIIAAKRGGKPVAFEPKQANRERIMQNLHLNKVAAHVYPYALSDRRGHAGLNYNSKVTLTTGASLVAGIDNHNAVEVVETIEMDALALTAVGIIKIDVERHELAVIRGAKRTIDRCRPMLIVEVLSEEAREAVLAELPKYEIAAYLDGRNILLRPR